MTALLHPSPRQSAARTRPEALAHGLRCAAAVALASLASLAGANAPARAQFMSNYPVIVVPPPPAQILVLPPRSNSRGSAPKSNPAPPPQQSQEYHGQTREPVGRF